MLPTYLNVPLIPGHSSPFAVEVEGRGHYPQEFYPRISLKPGTAFFDRIRAAMPSVPLERLEQPFVTFVRNELLLDWPEIDVKLREMGKDNWQPERGWWLYNASYAELLPKGFSRKWPGERNSIVVLNTGAHWSADRFQMQPVVDQSKAERLYVHMVRPASRACLTMQVDEIAS